LTAIDKFAEAVTELLGVKVFEPVAPDAES
jgi:hypothetical protein